MYLFFGIFLLLILLFYCINFLRRKKLIEKVCTMYPDKKWEKINELLQPFGYAYVPFQDLITSNINAWQREFGYHALFDKAASHVNMVIDCLPVYFDYQNRTWLVEFWKGQYGVNMGCEIGVYYADRILGKNERKHALFHSVSNDDLLRLAFTLSCCERCVAQLCAKHWWLTAFLPGSFANPSDLSLYSSITLQSPAMAESFVTGLIHAGYNRSEVYLCGNTVTFTFSESCTDHVPDRRQRWRLQIVQTFNLLGCRLYRHMTRPFCSTLDRLLYLYYYLPFVFRKMLHVIAFFQTP